MVISYKNLIKRGLIMEISKSSKPISILSIVPGRNVVLSDASGV